MPAAVGHSRDVTLVIPPALQGAFEGRREVVLGVPEAAGLGEVLEALLSLYPRLRQHLAGDRPATGGVYMHLALDEEAASELAAGLGGLATGRRLYLFSLSRPAPSVQTGLDG